MEAKTESGNGTLPPRAGFMGCFLNLTFVNSSSMTVLDGPDQLVVVF